ncbi:MAG: hypothetical protein A2622_07855 [Bdellovibrionales bacterium RIFCSPHIGHO2_01_FULL_40_29]|nr:MAG: hypothetical protein A2622_07855 [Bdellovibrionales bacterium RIFCSPHIGHO2_01_FULL_40_29]OFZ33720.1 MAG: hypothetical protein A3D17_09945 [Bdellovibrionales bacterium RIFCSPHIGHO2_02_FULL_40_15]
MKKIILTLSILLLTVTTSAGTSDIGSATQVIKNCSDAEAVQHRSDFISQEEGSSLSALYRNSETKTVMMAQVKRAMQILQASSIEPTNDYKYKLNYLGTTYDAINIDMGGNGHTVVFMENTIQEVNFFFYDGDMYINNKRCKNVTLPGGVQF